MGEGAKPNRACADLRTAITRLIRLRGQHTVAVKQVKAHLPQSAIPELISARDWAGNSNADAAASRGVTAHTPEVVRTMLSLQDKQQRAQERVWAVQRMCLAVLREASSFNRPASSTHARLAPQAVHPLQPPSGEPVDVRRFSQVLELARARRVGWESAIGRMLFEVQWARHELGACPWLVLLILFESMCSVTVNLNSSLQASPLATRQPTSAYVNAFRATFTRSVRALVHPHDQDMFKSRSERSRALSPLGFSDNISGVPMWPVVSAELLCQVSASVMEFRAKGLPAGWRGVVRGGGSLDALRLATLSLKPPPRWRPEAHAPGAGFGAVSAGQWFLSCPARCGSIVVLAHRPVREGSSWPKVRCGSCRVEARCGSCLCVACRRAVKDCSCIDAQAAPGQPTLHAFWGRG